MNKTEYVKTIEKALVGYVSAQELQDTVTYYRDYIDMEIRKGKTEQEVLEGLGNPRLLAKSIIAAKEQQGRIGDSDIAQEENVQHKGFRIPMLIIILVVLIVLGLVLSLVFAFMRFALPILLPVAIVMGIMSLYKKWNK